MKKIIILKGLPASGKSSFAKQLIKENPGAYKRVNKDDLRAMLDNSYHSKGNEKFVLKVRDFIIVEALRDGKHVIVDDTNLAKKHETHIRQLADMYKKETGQQIQVEVKFFEISVEECIRRDLKRQYSVGERVIKKMYKQFLQETDERNPNYREQDANLTKAIICDLDGTLAILNGRNPFIASDCEQDLLNEPVAKIVKQYYQLGHRIILLSGRLDTYKEETLRWLTKHEIPYHDLIMRKAGDTRKDSIVKKEFFEQHVQGKYYIDFILDDRNQVVDLWRNELRLPCLQVNYGNF